MSCLSFGKKSGSADQWKALSLISLIPIAVRVYGVQQSNLPTLLKLRRRGMSCSLLDESKTSQHLKFVTFVRHSVRLDTAVEGAKWEDSKTRPYDTPISDRELVKVAADRIIECNSKNFPTVVFSSPFRRCIQTACTLVKEFAVLNPASKVVLVIDNRLGEVMSQIRSFLKHSDVQSFSYCSIDEVHMEAAKAGIEEFIWFTERNVPPLDEDNDGFYARVRSFDKIVEDYACIIPDHRRIVVVTHADFLNVRLQQLEPQSLYAPLECGFFMETISSRNDDCEERSAVSCMHRMDKIM